MPTLRELPGYSRLRFDGQLTSFQSLLARSIERNEEPENSSRKVIAKNPLSPAEIISAAGARAYDLYTWEPVIQAVMKENVDLTGDAIDAGLSPDFNPWNLIMTGSTVTGSNTRVDAFTIACACWDDQIKKSWQVMTGNSQLPGYFWEIPRYDPEARKWALDFLKKELRQFADWLSDFTGKKISQDSLAESIRQANLVRQDMVELDRLMASEGKILPALEYYICQLFLGDYLGDGQELHRGLQALISELKTRQDGQADEEKSSQFRLYYMGDETQQFQLFNGMEDYGAVLVGSDVRFSLYYQPVKEEGPALENLAEWIWGMPCNMPTLDRVRATIPHIKQQKADGVLINGTTGSRNLPGSERMVRDLIKQELGLPVLSIETSLPRQDIEKVDYLVRAFIEMNVF